MHADVPLDDQSHERFWQQLLRGLVDGVADPVVVTLDREQVELGEPVRVTARVRDSTYIDLNDAAGRILVTSPAGTEREVPLEWSVEDDGMYARPSSPIRKGVGT